MKKNLLFTTLVVGSAFTAVSNAAVTALLDSTELNALAGSSDSFTQTFTDGGVSVDIEFTFSTSAGSLFLSGNRLGIDNAGTNIGSGAGGAASINEGEILTISASYVGGSVTGLGPGLVLGTVDLNFASIAVYRAVPEDSDITYTWDGSGRSAALMNTLTGGGYQGDVNRITDDQLHNLLGGNYSSAISVVHEPVVNNPSGARLGVDPLNGGMTINLDIQTIPEPSSAVLLSLVGALALGSRRRK